MLGAPSQGWLIIKMQRKISFTTSTLLDKIECTQIRRGRVYVHMIIMIIIQIIQIANYFFLYLVAHTAHTWNTTNYFWPFPSLNKLCNIDTVLTPKSFLSFSRFLPWANFGFIFFASGSVSKKNNQCGGRYIFNTLLFG